MTRPLLAAILLVGAVSVSAADDAARTKQIVEIAKAQLTADFKDPASVQYRGLYLVGHSLCGEVNAKNSYGGYVGFRRFYSEPSDATLGMPMSLSDSLPGDALIDAGSDADREFFQIGWRARCEPVGRQRLEVRP